MSKQRLYVVRIVREAYVLAASEEEAEQQRREIERWEDEPRVEVEPADTTTLWGWDDRCLVYHSGSTEITLADARAAIAKASA